MRKKVKCVLAPHTQDSFVAPPPRRPNEIGCEVLIRCKRQPKGRRRRGEGGGPAVIKGFLLLPQSDIAIKMYPVNPVFAPCAAREEERRGAERRRRRRLAVNKLVRGQTITGDAVRETAAVADTLSKFNYAVENIDGDVNGAEAEE